MTIITSFIGMMIRKITKAMVSYSLFSYSLVHLRRMIALIAEKRTLVVKPNINTPFAASRAP